MRPIALTLATATLLLGTTAHAQDAQPQEAPIVNGHRVAPRPVGPPPKDATDDAQKLLATAPNPGRPVQPHDLYGKPLGEAVPADQATPKPGEKKP
jgi:hypothetical protein